MRFLTLNGLMIISSACGALFYYVTTDESSELKKVEMVLISFFFGIIASDFIAELLSELTPKGVIAEAPLGALVASSMAVRLLSLLKNIVTQWVCKK